MRGGGRDRRLRFRISSIDPSMESCARPGSRAVAWRASSHCAERPPRWHQVAPGSAGRADAGERGKGRPQGCPARHSTR